MGRSAMDYSRPEMDAVHEAYDLFLDALDDDDREPDRWEEECLVYGLTAMTCGSYRLAAVELTVARTPLRQRSPESMRRLEELPQKITKQQMRAGLRRIKAIAG